MGSWRKGLTCLRSSPTPRTLIPASRGLSTSLPIAPSAQGRHRKGGRQFTALYMTTGSHDAVLIFEVPDGSDAVAIGMAAAASGSVSKIETVRAWSSSEFRAVAEKAAKVAKACERPGA
jgi:uncharacterized protein with GYD domain